MEQKSSKTPVNCATKDPRFIYIKGPHAIAESTVSLFLEAKARLCYTSSIKRRCAGLSLIIFGPDPTRKMRNARGTWASFAEIPVMITFHPSYLLRNGTMKIKRMVWEDMLEVMQKCGLEISEKQRGFFLQKS